MWIFLSPRSWCFGGLFAGYAVYRSIYPQAFAAGSACARSRWGHQHGGADLGQPDHGAGPCGPHRWDAGGQSLFCCSRHAARTAFLGIKFVEYGHKYAST